MNEKLDSGVQEIKYKVLKEVAKAAFNGTLDNEKDNIPNILVKDDNPTFRNSTALEKEIIKKYVKLAIGGNKDINNFVEVIDIACEKCPSGGYQVSDICRGCTSRRCMRTCRLNAISIDKTTNKCIIDKKRCVNCGLCAKACPYNAINNYLRPCEDACKVKALTHVENDVAKINDDKCIICGACVARCPFGAIQDKSLMLNVIDLIKGSNNNSNYNVYAVVAPAIATQFKRAKFPKLVTGIKNLGFKDVIEAALGADIVAYYESKELVEKGKLTTSCCPSFVTYIEKYFPELKDKISHNLSPMATIAKAMKENEPNCKIVFVGPCIAKKAEILKETVKPYVDATLTFEELNAMLDAKDIDIATLEDTTLDTASYFGRIFARAGGVKDAVVQGLKEENSNFALKGVNVDGIANCKIALTKMKSGSDEINFIEGMGCIGGCIGGPGMLTHGLTDRMEIEKHGHSSSVPTILESIKKVVK